MTLQVDPDDVVPVGLVHVERHLVPEDAGVVDEDVELAPCVDRLLDQVLGAGPGAHVVGVQGGLAAGRVMSSTVCWAGWTSAPAPSRSAPDVVHDHLGAFGGQ